MLICGACGLGKAAGNINATAGCLVQKTPGDGQFFILTCAHAVGDEGNDVFGPANATLGKVFRRRLSHQTDGVDAALVAIDPALDGGIPALGVPTGWVGQPTEGMKVFAYSRIDAKANGSIVEKVGHTVDLGGNIYTNQMRCPIFTKDGDSGAVVVSDVGSIVGLVVGIEVAQGNRYTIVTPISAIRAALAFDTGMRFVVDEARVPDYSAIGSVAAVAPPRGAAGRIDFRPDVTCSDEVAADCQRIFNAGFSTHRAAIISVAAEKAVPVNILAALGAHESAWGGVLGPDLRGDKGRGHGLMQIDIGAHRSWLTANDWTDPKTNIAKGADIYLGGYRRYRQVFGSETERHWAAAVCYNSGFQPDPADGLAAADAQTTPRKFSGKTVRYGQAIMERAAWFYDQNVR